MMVASRVELRRPQKKERLIMMRIHELRDEFSQEAQRIERLIKTDHEFLDILLSKGDVHEIDERVVAIPVEVFAGGELDEAPRRAVPREHGDDLDRLGD
jgi:hypothetical protein